MDFKIEKIRSCFNIRVIVLYTDLFLGKWRQGRSLGPIVIIHPESKKDRTLLDHELVHSKQWWCSLGLQSILYTFSKKHRLKYEIEAYKTKYDRISNKRWAICNITDLLHRHYKLDMTKDQILKELMVTYKFKEHEYCEDNDNVKCSYRVQCSEY